MITAEALCEQVDPALAVDQALSPAQRRAFTTWALDGRYAGAQPADWLADAYDTDAYIDRIDPWWERHGDRMVSELGGWSDLPDRLLSQIVSYSVRAWLGTGSLVIPADLGGIPERAVVWAHGYAFRLGWCPDDSEPARPSTAGRGRLVFRHLGTTWLGTADADVTPRHDLRWFRCRHCRVLFVGPPIDDSPVRAERDACLAHESGCTARAVVIRWDNDEQVTFLAGGREIATVNQDSHGSAGISVALKLVEQLCAVLDVPVTNTE